MSDALAVPVTAASWTRRLHVEPPPDDRLIRHGRPPSRVAWGARGADAREARWHAAAAEVHGRCLLRDSRDGARRTKGSLRRAGLRVGGALAAGVGLSLCGKENCPDFGQIANEAIQSSHQALK